MHTRPFLIAEIGFNHEGDTDLALTLIKQAADAGADCVKFQSFRTSDIALPTNEHYDLIKKGEMDKNLHFRLADAANKCGVEFVSTPFGPWAVDILEELGVKRYKVASMDCTNHHLLGIIAQTKKPVMISTGMATIKEIRETLAFMRERKSGLVTLLHCMSLYPATAEALNLAIIPRLRELFHTPIGYSDHYPGVSACLAAAVLGAEVIETHFTHDVTAEGGDHAHSADAAMLRELREGVDLFTTMIGDEAALDNRSDREYANAYRRGVYAAADLDEGVVIGMDKLLLARPVSQLAPNDIDKILGSVTARKISAFEPLDFENLRNQGHG